MARGQSRAQSELSGSNKYQGYGFIPDMKFKDKAEAQAQGAVGMGIWGKDELVRENIDNIEEIIRAQARGDMSGYENLDGISEAEIKQLAENQVEAASEVIMQAQEFEYKVTQLKDALAGKSKGVVDFSDPTEVAEMLPLTLKEIENDESPFDIMLEKSNESRTGWTEKSLKAFVKERLKSAEAEADNYRDEINYLSNEALENFSPKNRKD
jgi:hypothetical protein